MITRVVLLPMALGLLGTMSLAGISGKGAYAVEAEKAAPAETSKQTEDDGPMPYLPSDDPMADVDRTISEAAATGKLAMIVLGANWCHDSQALVAHFKTPDMAALLEHSYELQLINVGLFEHGADIIQRFGMPVIYGTPTVLIIHPASQRLVNAGNMHQWRDADSISTEDTLAYFSMMAEDGKKNLPVTLAPDALKALYADIDAFETAQSVRINGGYDVLRPLMADQKENPTDEFTGLWKELSALRYSITGDLDKLRTEARSRVEASETDIDLSYPEYAGFSWE